MIGRVVPLRRIEGRIEEMTDEALVGACGFSDPAALAALFDRHHLRMHRFLCRVAGTCNGDAEDLLQDTFAAVWTSAHRYRGQAPALTWIFGIAANVARNHARSRDRRAHAMQALGELPPPRSEQADDIAARRELLGRLQAGLTALPHNQRVALVMCDFEGVSGNDAATALGVRPGTIWRWLHQARKSLRSAVGEEVP